MGTKEGGRRLPLQIALLALLAVLVAAVLAACGPAASQEAPAGHRSAGTVIRTFSPYDSQGRLVVRAAKVADGRCFTASVAAPSTRTYRCFSGNQILDPCVSPPSVGGTTPVQVACRATPWSGAVVLHLKSALPAAAPIGERGRPWALELDNGAHCIAATGTVLTVADTSLPYRCTNAAAVAVVDPMAHTVVVDYARAGATTLRRLTVRTMWRS